MTFPEAEFNAMLERYQAETGKSWPELLRQQGRLIAVNLALETQPYGFDQAQEMGKGAVLRDIGRIYWSLSEAYQGLKEKSEKAARVFWKAALQKKWDLATRILKSSGIDAPIGKLQEDLHPARRDRRGHVRKNSLSQVVPDARQIDRYIKKIQNRVGTGKSGWATVANELGGMRGIPHWVKRNKGAGGVDDKSRSFNNPSIGIHNDVPYIANLCKQAAVNKATRMQKEKMEKHIEKVLHFAGRKAGMK